MWQTPVSTVGPRNCTPRASRRSRALATSATRNAMPAVFGANGSPSASGSHSPSVRFGVSNSRWLWPLVGRPRTSS
jgi:hypothetical protein